MNIINLLVRNFVTMSKISRGPRKRTWNLIISTVGIRIPAIGSNASQASGTFADVSRARFSLRFASRLQPMAGLPLKTLAFPSPSNPTCYATHNDVGRRPFVSRSYQRQHKFREWLHSQGRICCDHRRRDSSWLPRSAAERLLPVTITHPTSGRRTVVITLVDLKCLRCSLVVLVLDRPHFLPVGCRLLAQ